MADIKPPRPPLNKGSDAWVSHLRPWIRRRVEELRDELERPGSNIDFIRGQIDELRHIVRETEPDAPAPGTSGTY